MRNVRKILILVFTLAVMTMGMAVPAQAGTEGAFLSKINASRAAAGLPPVAVSSELVPDARAHSAEMMAAGEIYHTSNLAAVASGWEALAENVGAGPSVDSLHTAFMNSAGHRRNILGNYNYVGIGVSQSDSGQLWVTVIFMRKGSTPPPPTTTTTTTAPPAAPPTTAAPTTTIPEAAPPTTTAPTTTVPKATTTTSAPAKRISPTTTTSPAPAPSKRIQRSGWSLYLPLMI